MGLRTAAKSKGAAVHSPRHVIFFRVNDSDAMEVVRILHDSMDVARPL
ncbi:MAG: type II toxin-antitoxin system RelE/ParE family toxin [Akkermansiaceae bacterium]|nr:type II toxin-antitoxin system RelE/ParE family toxin [Akkermansiaceae bacterium]MCP5549532.1 type II toxin-antitoxin system RelE/ParE family toxin [Akkermansiaceae bacterium]